MIVRSQSGNNINSAIGHRIIYDQVDSKIKPTAGYLLTLSQSLAGLGGNSRYIKNEVEAKYFYPLTEDIILKVQGEAGNIQGLGRAVRVMENFNLGDNTFRGF